MTLITWLFRLSWMQFCWQRSSGSWGKITVMTVALACFYNYKQLGHVDAELRAWDLKKPLPEEVSRVMACRLALGSSSTESYQRSNIYKYINAA